MNNRILVIDDEESVLEDYRLILARPKEGMTALLQERERLGREFFGEAPGRPTPTPEYYEVSTASQGKEGYEKVLAALEQRAPFAVAFIDVRMPPGWDGMETARMIRMADPRLEIVVVTAYTDRERSEIVEKVGSPERLLYLKKPFDPDEIKQMALSLTRKWDLERKAENHLEYLERLLRSVRRLKSLDLVSVKEVLEVILSEVLSFVDGSKGIIVRQAPEGLQIEMASSDLEPKEAQPLLDRLKARSLPTDNLQWLDGVLVVPLKDLSGNLFMLLLNIRPPLREDKNKLLRLLLESCSDVLVAFEKRDLVMKSERAATIGQIAAGLIHEISNPLTAIINAVHLHGRADDKMWDYVTKMRGLTEGLRLSPQEKALLDGLYESFDLQETRQKMSSYREIIESGSQRVETLMKNVRGFAKASERLDLKWQDLSGALEDTLVLLHNNLKYGVTVFKDIEVPLGAYCDSNSLKQVFLNLILNALQAMKNAGQLWITARTQGEEIAITIRDSGPGIAPEIQERIFEAFFSTKPDGTGLGLSIVKGIIEKHGGNIRVESEPGQGAAFHLHIPAQPPGMISEPGPA